LSTGDELVEAPALPGPGQIRNGNGPMLMAQAASAGAVAKYLGVAADRRDSLLVLMAEGLKSDVLVLSGGVSAGKMDLVPEVLAELGVEAIFHKVAMKPGKPIFGGILTLPSGRLCIVAGLPGNPGSAFVGFELFVRPVLRALMGLPPLPNLAQAQLAEDFALRTDRPTYYPARLMMDKGTLKARPAAWFGSPDLRGLGAANGFIVFPAGDHVYQAGKLFDVLTADFELP
jgi:molybdopterin molybdotransferase